MTRHTFRCIEGHTEGMPVRMVIAGAPELSGASMSERRRQFVAEHDWIRRALMLEPRGHGHMSGTLLYPPLSAEADFSLLFIETSGCLPMCGHATLGSIAFALESGLVEPRTAGEVLVDVPAGQVRARYRMEGGKVGSVRFTNVPSFLLLRDLTVQLPALGELRLDIAYGGNFYPIIEPQPNYPGCEHFSPQQLLEWGAKCSGESTASSPWSIRRTRASAACGTACGPAAPGGGLRRAQRGDRRRQPGGPLALRYRYFRTSRPTPCAGLLAPGEVFRHESLIGSRFDARVESATELADGTPAVYPNIEGRAFITSHSEHHVDRSHPYWNGFSLEDFSGTAHHDENLK